MDTPIVPQKRCSKCHQEFPATIEYFQPAKRYKGGLFSWCKPCRAAYNKENRLKPENLEKEVERRNSQHSKEMRRKYYQTDAYKEQQRARQKNPERLAWQREYAQRPDVKARNNSERYKGYRRKFRQTPHGRALTNEQARKDAHKHPEKNRAYYNLRRTRILGLPTQFTQADWHHALDYFGGCCCICGRPAGLWHTIAREHWIPLTDHRPDNPGTVPTNIVPMCHSKSGGENGCNNLKSNKDPLIWLTERYGKRKATTIHRRIQAYFEWVREQDQH